MDEKKVAINGGLWTGVSTAVTMLSQILRIVILTRFLEKSDFGVVSLITMVLGFCLAFADLGFSSVVMYKQEMTNKEFSSLFWIQFALYSLLYLILCAISPLIANFYAEPLLSTLIPIAALSMLSLAFGKLHESVLQKRYEFKSLAIRNIISNVLSLFLAWFLAIKGFGVLSMIISTLFQNLIYNVWSIIAGLKYQKIVLSLDFYLVLPLIKIGLYQTYTRIADYFSSQLDVLIIGKLLGTEVLGVYDLAKQLIFRFSGFVRTVVAQVALPILSNNNNNDQAVITRFLSITKIVAILSIPTSAICAIFSHDIIIVLYGSNYLEAAPILAIFSIITAISSITSFFDMLGIAKGRTDLNFKCTIYRIVLTTPIVLICSYLSIEFVAWGQVFATFLVLFLVWRIIISNTYKISMKDYVGQFWKMLVSITPLSIALYFFNSLILSNIVSNIYLRLTIEILVFICAAFILICTYLKKDVKYLTNLIRNR